LEDGFDDDFKLDKSLLRILRVADYMKNEILLAGDKIQNYLDLLKKLAWA
jgi:hypothetical protein